MQKVNTNLAAEFYVASQLFRLGHNVTLTLGHTKEIDLIITHPEGHTTTIDVKGLKNKTNWPIQAKLKRKNHFYILVCYLDKIEDLKIHPEVFVIPSDRIDEVLEPWSKTTQVDTSAVNYKDIKNSRFKDAWLLIR